MVWLALHKLTQAHSCMCTCVCVFVYIMCMRACNACNFAVFLKQYQTVLCYTFTHKLTYTCIHIHTHISVSVDDRFVRALLDNTTKRHLSANILYSVHSLVARWTHALFVVYRWEDKRIIVWHILLVAIKSWIISFV